MSAGYFARLVRRGIGPAAAPMRIGHPDARPAPDEWGELDVTVPAPPAAPQREPRRAHTLPAGEERTTVRDVLAAADTAPPHRDAERDERTAHAAGEPRQPQTPLVRVSSEPHAPHARALRASDRAEPDAIVATAVVPNPLATRTRAAPAGANAPAPPAREVAMHPAPDAPGQPARYPRDTNAAPPRTGMQPDAHDATSWVVERNGSAAREGGVSARSGDATRAWDVRRPAAASSSGVPRSEPDRPAITIGDVHVEIVESRPSLVASPTPRTAQRARRDGGSPARPSRLAFGLAQL